MPTEPHILLAIALLALPLAGCVAATVDTTPSMEATHAKETTSGWAILIGVTNQDTSTDLRTGSSDFYILDADNKQTNAATSVFGGSDNFPRSTEIKPGATVEGWVHFNHNEGFPWTIYLEVDGHTVTETVDPTGDA